jgi:hypothetical protein
MSPDHYNMHERWHHIHWLASQAKYFLAIMSVTTSENRFIPQPIHIPAEFKILFGDMPGMRQSFQMPDMQYPAWFNQYYAEDAAIMLLRFCFPEGKVPAGSRYVDLNRRQQRLLSLLAEHQVFWPDQRPYIMRRQMQERYRKMEEKAREMGVQMDILEQMRASLSFIKPLEEGSYEEELDASAIVQLLRRLDLPATQEALQAYVSAGPS